MAEFTRFYGKKTPRICPGVVIKKFDWASKKPCCFKKYKRFNKQVNLRCTWTAVAHLHPRFLQSDLDKTCPFIILLQTGSSTLLFWRKKISFISWSTPSFVIDNQECKILSTKPVSVDNNSRYRPLCLRSLRVNLSWGYLFYHFETMHALGKYTGKIKRWKAFCCNFCLIHKLGW